MIGQETLDRVRQLTGIVELIGESVKLTKRGRSHTGLCPFHKEKTPSFHVNEERGFYHCFGCAESGDCIKFVQQTEGLTFLEAVRRLAERAGIEIVETSSDAERKQQAELRRRQQELYDVGNAAAAFFERMLREHPLRQYALAELERRALHPEGASREIADALQAFRIGYAPYGWDALGKHLRESGLSAHAAEKVGLLAPRKQGPGHYDRFRHRLMFAVLDLQGRVIAFSGRALEEPTQGVLEEARIDPLGSASAGEAPAKYVNSPESPIYRKREAVFGLYQARQALRSSERALVVEGNFDVLSLHARGIHNAIAPLGTAFTTEQAKQIKRFAPRVILLFDGDTAGRKAARAARDACRQAALEAQVGTLPEGSDPDELVRTQGAEGITRIVQAARGMLEYLIDITLDSTFSADDARAKAARIKEVTELLASEEDPAVRAMAKRHADSIAPRLGISDATTLDALERSVRVALLPRQTGEATPANRVEPPARARSRDRRDDIGGEILGALLDYPVLFDTPEVLEGLELLEGELAASIAALRQGYDGSSIGHPEEVLAKLSPSIHPFALARLAAPRHERLEDARTELVGNVKKLKGLELQRHKSEVVVELQRAAATGDFEHEVALLREQMRRARERHGL
ncbi:MAG TPA: CHC2 zinc finger domain-containing protein [Polyangiaceae bacterium]